MLKLCKTLNFIENFFIKFLYTLWENLFVKAVWRCYDMVWYEIILQRRWNFETIFIQIPSRPGNRDLQYSVYSGFSLSRIPAHSQLPYCTYCFWWSDSVLWIFYYTLFAVVSLYGPGSGIFYLFQQKQTWILSADI